MNRATITPTDNGPYLVQGNVTLTDANGIDYEVDHSIALCRCGLSATKPFCDGSHAKAHFSAVNRAGGDYAAGGSSRDRNSLISSSSVML